jgi:hypothetical protein
MKPDSGPGFLIIGIAGDVGSPINHRYAEAGLGQFPGIDCAGKTGAHNQNAAALHGIGGQRPIPPETRIA